ncbi:MAG TPA: hypothetical protein PLH57_01940 [Oligoflexia bacterium]|nr:hypothetical protein [Oligoflexia bacterium]
MKVRGIGVTFAGALLLVTLTPGVVLAESCKELVGRLTDNDLSQRRELTNLTRELETLTQKSIDSTDEKPIRGLLRKLEAIAVSPALNETTRVKAVEVLRNTAVSLRSVSGSDLQELLFRFLLVGLHTGARNQVSILERTHEANLDALASLALPPRWASRFVLSRVLPTEDRMALYLHFSAAPQIRWQLFEQAAREPYESEIPLLEYVAIDTGFANLAEALDDHRRVAAAIKVLDQGSTFGEWTSSDKGLVADLPNAYFFSNFQASITRRLGEVAQSGQYTALRTLFRLAIHPIDDEMTELAQKEIMRLFDSGLKDSHLNEHLPSILEYVEAPLFIAWLVRRNLNEPLLLDLLKKIETIEVLTFKEALERHREFAFSNRPQARKVENQNFSGQAVFVSYDLRMVPIRSALNELQYFRDLPPGALLDRVARVNASLERARVEREKELVKITP